MVARFPAVTVRAAVLDVTDVAAQREAFRAHVDAFGGLQVRPYCLTRRPVVLRPQGGRFRTDGMGAGEDFCTACFEL